MGLSLESQLCWVKVSFKTVTASTVGLTLGVHFSGASGRQGSYLVLGWMELHPVPCSVGWHWDKGPLQGSQLGLQFAGLLPGKWAGLTLLRSWEGCCLVIEWVPGWAGLALDYAWEELDMSPRFFGVSQPRMRCIDMALEVQMGMSSTRSLHGLDYSWPWLEGSKQTIGLFQDPWGTCVSISHWISGPAVLLMDYGWEGLKPCIGSFQDLQGHRQQCLMPGPYASHCSWTVAGIG